MTKQGYTHIIVPKHLHDQLKSLAEQNNLSINQLIAQLININFNVSINTSINTAQLNQQHLSIPQALNQQNSPNQAPFNEKGMPTCVSTSQKPILAGPRGFEPRIFGSGGLRTAFSKRFDALIQTGLRAPNHQNHFDVD